MLLALKTIFSSEQGVTSITIFDEVDTGVVEELHKPSRRKFLKYRNTLQVLCITHLPRSPPQSPTINIISVKAVD